MNGRVRKARPAGPRTWALRLGAAALGVLCGMPPALAAFGAHYEGRSRDGQTYRLYLDGGAYAGQADGLQAIRVTVRRERGSASLPVNADCTYHWHGRDHLQSRLVCAAGPAGPLAGAVYARDPKDAPASAGGEEGLLCVRHCSARAPRRLSLQDADEDNH